MDINETRWYMYHFDGDPIEAESIRITVEVFKTLAVMMFATVVYLTL